MTLYLVRHGEASGDEGDDPGLSTRGEAQTRALAHRLSGRSSTIWHGPRRRTTETAQLLGASLGASTRPSGLLEDRTAVPSPGRRDDYPAHRQAWFDAVPVDERDEDGVELTRAWAELSRLGDHDDVVLVSHSFVIAWFVREVLGAPPAAWLQLTVANTGLTILTRDDHLDLHLEAFNDTSHIQRDRADISD